MGEGAHHHLHWDCDADEVRFAFFLVPRYEVLCFRDLLLYSLVACCLVVVVHEKSDASSNLRR